MVAPRELPLPMSPCPPAAMVVFGTDIMGLN